MNNLPFLAYSHTYNSGWTDWIAHRAVSAVIHAVVYGAVFKLMRQMTKGEAIVVRGRRGCGVVHVVAVSRYTGMVMTFFPRVRLSIVRRLKAYDYLAHATDIF